MYDVIVVGGGPSGLNAARRLAEQGLGVMVLESKGEIGESVICTGIVGLNVFSEFGLSRDSLLSEIKKVTLTSPYGNALKYEHPQTFAYVVDREKFDKHLGSLAAAKGAEIKLRTEAVDISVNKDSVKVLTHQEGKFRNRYSARMALIATGINYQLNKKLGLGYPRNFIAGVQAELKFSGLDCPGIYVGNGVAPGAFAWMVPVGGGMVRAGMMTEKNPQGYFATFMNKFFPDTMRSLDKNHVKVKPIARGLVSQTYGERVLVVGEAAGQVKTTTGGGVYYGLLCSEIASQVLSERFKEGDFSARALSEYEAQWKNTLKKELLIGYYTRKLCANLRDSEIERLFQIARNDGVIPLIKEKGNFDWHSDLIIALLKRLPLLQTVKNCWVIRKDF